MAFIEEQVGVDGVPASPPLKRMRGSVVSDKGEMLESMNRDVIKPASVVDGVPSWETSSGIPAASGIPPITAASQDVTRDGEILIGNRILPKPSAIRYCPPGMRIRGAIPLPEKADIPNPALKKKNVNERLLPPKPVGLKPLSVRPVNVKPRVDPVVNLSDSGDSGPESEKPRVVPYRSSLHDRGAPSTSRLKKRMAVRPRKPPISRGIKSPGAGDGPVFESGARELNSADPRTRVKFLLQQFDNLRRQFLAEEMNRVRTAGAGSKRPDLRASQVLKQYRVNGRESIYGPVPGVEVGDHYYYRIELLIISLHRQLQGGIDYIRKGMSRFCDKNGRPVSVAVSVCASGGYEDDHDEGDNLIYTGQGGNNYKGDKRQSEDQTLTRGNLALYNCRDLGLAVRVIRGIEYKKTVSQKNVQTPSGKIYYYDGLYDVVHCYQETGSAGFKVWKFKLVRRPNQGPLSSSLVLFRGKSLPTELKARGQRILSDDLSNGQEPVKVRVVGCMDDDRVPSDFQYVTSLRYSPGVPRPSAPKPCPCNRDCTRQDCTCLILNAGLSYNEDGALLRAKKLVYECGPQCCRSDSKCVNRVTQKGLRFDLEVFRTEGKGWGVRCSNFIPQGSFVCEYIGEIIHESDAEKRVCKDEYMFDLKIPDSMERRFGDVSGVVKEITGGQNDEDDDDDPNCQHYTVDANRIGNLARFINHSCAPNLFVQCVLYDHHDHRFPHIMLFASEHISPYTELSYDYGYELGKIKVNGKIKVKKCNCGASSCRGRLY